MASITHLTSLLQLNKILGKDTSKVSVIDFHASWCGPCHAIAPTFEEMAKLYGNKMNFLKCDVDATRDVASEYKVSAMPTFIFFKGTTKIDQLRGADKAGLKSKCEKYASSSSSSPSFSGKGHTLGGAEVSPTITDNIKAHTEGVSAAASGLDPQLKVLFGLIGLYAVFYFLS